MNKQTEKLIEEFDWKVFLSDEGELLETDLKENIKILVEKALQSSKQNIIKEIKEFANKLKCSKCKKPMDWNKVHICEIIKENK